jgi:hypothetical protein
MAKCSDAALEGRYHPVPEVGQQVDLEAVRVEDRDVVRIARRRREILDVERHERVRSTAHRSGENVPVLDVTSHRAHEMVVVVDERGGTERVPRFVQDRC